MITGRLLAGVAASIALLTYLLIETRPPHRGPWARMEEALVAMHLHEAELNRDVLMARAGLLSNYDSLGQTGRKLLRDAEILTRESATLSKDRSGAIHTETAALATGIKNKLQLIEYLKSDNALLRNSVAYFNESMRTVEGGANYRRHAIQVAKLSHAMLHFVQSQEPASKQEALAALSRVSALAKQQPDLEPLALHGSLIIETLANIDGLVSRIVSSATGDHQEALQKAMLVYGAEGEQRAQRFRLLLYLVALILLGYVLHTVARLRARARELRSKELQLIQANKMTSLGTLVSGVAHEINNPNQVILMNAGVLSKVWSDTARLLETCGRDSRAVSIAGLPYREMLDTTPRLIQDIEDASRRIERIVGDLKNFARPGGNVHERFQLNDVVHRALRLLTDFVRKRTDAFRVQLADNVPCLSGNSQQVEQVVLNLVINALEALPDRRCGVTVATFFDSARHAAAIEVRDEGVGIAREQLAHLGEPFFTTKQATGGTGLGLAITSTLVRMHRGTLEFDSEAGKGTRATVALPCLDERRDVAHAEGAG